MYDKLGELLNEALEKEEIPQKKKPLKQSQDDGKSEEIKENNSSFRKSGEKIHISSQKKDIPTGEVIKMHKYTKNMHIPPEVIYALGTLYLVYPVDWKVVKRQYHTLIKQVHPDTGKGKTTIQTSESVLISGQQNSSPSVDELKAAYNLLKNWYKKSDSKLL